MVHNLIDGIVGSILGIIVGGLLVMKIGHGGEGAAVDLIVSSSVGALTGSSLGLFAGLTGGVIGGVIAAVFSVVPPWISAAPGFPEIFTMCLVTIVLAALAPMIVPH